MYVILVLILMFIGCLFVGNKIMTNDAIGSVARRDSYREDNLKIIERYILNCDCYDFETICTYLFQMSGYRAFQTPKSADGGKDIILYDPSKEKIFVECKHYSECNRIGTPIINKLIGVCANNNVKKALIITTSSYSAEAIKLIDSCKVVNVERMYVDDLIQMASPHHVEVLNWLYGHIKIAPTY